MSGSRNSNGPLRFSTLTQVGSTDGVIFWSNTRPPEVEPLDIDAETTLEIGTRHDLLSYRQYRLSQLGWVIMERNKDIVPEEIDMRLWPNDFVPGLTIKIPTIRSLRSRGIVS